MTADDLRAYVERGEFCVPPLSEVAIRVTELALQDEASASEVVELVSRDAGLSSDLLRYSNSVTSGSRVEIVSVHQAVVHLGMKRVSEVALAASLRSGLLVSASYGRLSKEIWTRSVATALVSRQIAQLLAQSVEVVFVCGLFWNIGEALVLRAIGEMSVGASLPDEEEAEMLSAELSDLFRDAAMLTWRLPVIVCEALKLCPVVEESSPEAWIASLAHDLAPPLLSEEDIDIQAFTARPEADCLNLYLEQFEALAARAPEIRSEIGAML